MKFAKKRLVMFEKKRKSFGKLRNERDFLISPRIAKEAWKLRILLGQFYLPNDEEFAFLVFEVGSKRGVQGSTKISLLGGVVVGCFYVV